MSTYALPFKRRSWWNRVKRWVERNLHRYVASVLLLLGLIYAAGLNLRDLMLGWTLS